MSIVNIYVLYNIAETAVYGIFSTIEKTKEYMSLFLSKNKDFSDEDFVIYKETLDQSHIIGMDDINVLK